MSANNGIFINRKTYSVNYQPCMDNNDLGELVGVGKTLEEAIKIAEKCIKDCDGMVEYGIFFVSSGVEHLDICPKCGGSIRVGEGHGVSIDPVTGQEEHIICPNLEFVDINESIEKMLTAKSEEKIKERR